MPDDLQALYLPTTTHFHMLRPLLAGAVFAIWVTYFSNFPFTSIRFLVSSFRGLMLNIQNL